MNEPRIVHGLSNEDYHAGRGLSCSGVKRLRRSPFQYHALTLPSDAPRSEPTAAMFNGTLTHCALLEPGEFDKRYKVGPDVSKNSNAWKDWAAQAAADGITAITAQQRETAQRQALALSAIPDIATLLNDGAPEVSAYWIDAESGILCKCRPDWVAPVAYGSGVILVDVKTASDASPGGFARQCASFGYHLQADWYSRGYAAASGLEVFGFVFAVVESEYPHDAAPYMLSERDLKKAEAANREALTLFARCQAAGQWPGYAKEIQILELPAWA